MFDFFTLECSDRPKGCFTIQLLRKTIGFTHKSDFVWSTHIGKLSIELKKRIGLLRRLKNRVPKEKNVIIAEAIFNSLLRYGVAVFLKTVYDKEDLNMKKLPKTTAILPSNTTEQYAKGDFWS